MFGPRSRLHRFENLTLVFFSRHQKLAKYINPLHPDLQCLLNNSVGNVNYQALPNVPILALPVHYIIK